jgi:hypothetical protein
MSVRKRRDALRRAGWWKPSAAAYLLRNQLPRATAPLPSDDASLQAAAAWLARAQDATADGGISGRYRLAGGWSSSYPETTGYAIPTLLALADVLADDRYRERAGRAVDFLLSVQLSSGAFPGLEIADNRTAPSPFNSAQIVHGLHRWLRATGDSRVRDPMMRAARWIASVQDSDGAWRRHAYRDVACTYSAFAAGWLADVAVEYDEAALRAAAERHLRWVLQQRDPQTGWIDLCGFSTEDHAARRAHTHTIAYTLAGILRLSERLDVRAGIDAVQAAAERVLRRFERSRTLAGVLDYRWRPIAKYACLTGNAQFAVIWLEVAARTGDARFANAAFKAIDEVKRAQSIASPNDGIRGGIAGSFPVGGDYIPFAFPNWAAKFFIDALCAKRAWLAAPRRLAGPPGAGLTDRPVTGGTTPIALTAERRVAVYTTRISPMFAHLAEQWQRRGFTPSLVVIETGTASRGRRFASALRRRLDDSASVCRRYGWRHVRAGSVNFPQATAAIAAQKPLIAVNAGAGILREAVLAIPQLGTLGVHMGILPAYRGMNVAEWAFLNGDPVGCSIFWVDPGIDTGPVIVTSRVDVTGCQTIAELRTRVDARQLADVDTVVQSIVERGELPLSCPQAVEDGRLFFRMHADLRRLLELSLASEKS